MLASPLSAPTTCQIEFRLIRLNRIRRLAGDYESQPGTLAGLHFVVVAVVMLVHFAALNNRPNML
ncbi:hypothetical protein FAZ97_32100 [Paraburkholderia acidiphila]|uniref:Uncharacterized protein n=1 Tax=Paraburkholderia acidiphila TaxID=2571747 RepID=A0A7Z2GDS0_9BURK|nr:hypothetical protein FAZ97_32100 [Paraburkholderia acidiphila]